MFRRIVLLALGVLAAACLGGAQLQAQQNVPQNAQQTEPRIAFVVGNAGYAPGALPATLNDAGLVAEALRSIGFEIIEGADLSQADLVRSYREFLAKVEASGPDTLAFVYFSGHALSFEGENYLLGIDARLTRESDIPIEGVRLSDLMRPLADSPARAKVVMIDAMRPLPFRPQGKGLARGLEAIDPPQGMLIAYATAPGTVAPDQPGNYGPYATAIAEMLRAPGTDLETAFTHIRSRTHLTTEGKQTPWHVSALGEQIELLPPEAATASAPPPPPIRQARPMREIGPDEAYALAIEMDTLEGYTGFVQAYPGHPLHQAGLGDDPRAARGAGLDARAREQHAAILLDLSAPLSERHVCVRRRAPPAPARRGGCAAAGLRHDGVRRRADGAVRRAGGIRRGVSRRAAAAARPLRRAAPGLSRQPAAAAAAWLVAARGSSILPALAIAIPLAAALAPAPRRALAPDAGGGNRQGGSGARGGNRNAPAVCAGQRSAKPGCRARTRAYAVTPNAAIAPSTRHAQHRRLPLRRRRRAAIVRRAGVRAARGHRALPAARRSGVYPPAQPRQRRARPVPLSRRMRLHRTPRRRAVRLRALRRRRRAARRAPGSPPSAGWRAASGHCQPHAAGNTACCRAQLSRSQFGVHLALLRRLPPVARRAVLPDRRPASPTARRHRRRHRSPARRRRGHRDRRRR